jgi:hypothetical protein
MRKYYESTNFKPCKGFSVCFVEEEVCCEDKKEDRKDRWPISLTVDQINQ